MPKLGDIASISAGHPFRGAITQQDDGNGRVIQMKDVERGAPIPWAELIQTQILGRGTPDWLRQDDVIFLARGRYNFAAHLPEVPENTVCSPHFFIIRVHSEEYFPAFIAWQINQLPIQMYLNRCATGSTQRNITAAALKDAQILPVAREKQEDIARLQDLAARERQIYQALMANRELQMESVARHVLGIEPFHQES